MRDQSGPGSCGSMTRKPAMGFRGRELLLVDTKNPDQPEFTSCAVRKHRPYEFQSKPPVLAVQQQPARRLPIGRSCVRLGRQCVQVAQPLPDFQLSGKHLSIDLPAPDTPPAPPVTETPTRDLWNRVRAGTATLPETMEFHQRLALPFACFAFALIGLPLGVSTNRGGRSTGLVSEPDPHVCVLSCLRGRNARHRNWTLLPASRCVASQHRFLRSRHHPARAIGPPA